MIPENIDKLKKSIRSIPDFPISGITFRDITTLLKEGDLFAYDAYGLELQVENACTCSAGEEGACGVPLQCCGKDMVKK